MPRVCHFEIHADNPERAAKFYTKIFGWKIEKWKGPMDYWMVNTGDDTKQGKGTWPGINGGLLKRNTPISGEGVIAYVCTIDVPSVDEYEKKIKSNGGKIAVPKMAIPGMGWLLYAKDTEGNIFGIMQEDKSAK